jgi:hypothetical protein
VLGRITSWGRGVLLNTCSRIFHHLLGTDGCQPKAHTTFKKEVPILYKNPGKVMAICFCEEYLTMSWGRKVLGWRKKRMQDSVQSSLPKPSRKGQVTKFSTRHTF